MSMHAAAIGRSRWFFVSTVIAWVLALFLLLPVFVAVPVAFTGRSYISLPSGTDWSLRHFGTLSEGRWAEAALNSMTIGAAVSLIATIVGTCAAISLWRASANVRLIGSAILMAPLIVPPVIVGLALYRPWTYLGLLDTWTGTVLAHSIVATPLVVVVVSAALSTLDVRIDDAARSLGSSLWQRLVYAILPNIRMGVATGAVLAFITSWDEFVITLLLTQRRLTTLPLALFQGIKDNFDPVIAAVATLLVLVTSLAFLVRPLRRAMIGSSR